MKRYKLVLLLSGFLLLPFRLVAEYSHDIVSVTPSSGQLQYELPLYEIETPDFKWPIALSYVSDGFLPYEYSSPVGYGWSLIAGGAISREIVGIADDLEIEDILLKGGGYLAYLRESAHLPTFLYGDRDIASDVYYFSFAGYSGSFIITDEEHIKILSGDPINVDISGIGLQPHRAQTSYSAPNTYSEIVISTGDGYKYYFGGGEKDLEFSNATNTPEAGTTISSWRLRKIEAPSGATLTFWNRSRLSATSLSQYDVHYQWYSDDYFNNTYLMNDQMMRSNSLDMYQETSCHMGYDVPKRTQTKYSVLDSITLSPADLTISFSYNWRTNQVYINQSTTQQMPFLSQVKARTRNRILQSWNLSYETISYSGRTYLFLSTLNNASAETYSYGYYGIENCSTMEIGEQPDCDVFGYSINYPKFGTLIRSTNALGATNYYTYELATYSQVGTLEQANECFSFITRPYDQQICHTVRLDSIRVQGNNKTYLTKKYRYQDIAGESSGYLLADYATYDNGMYNYYPFQKTKREASHILYSSVIEDVCDYTDNSRRRSIYCYPKTIHAFCLNGDTPYALGRITHIARLTPYLMLRNELQSPIKRQLFTIDGIKLKEFRYTYDFIDTETRELLLNNSCWQFTGNPKLLLFNKTQVEYSRENADSLVECFDFTYDNQYRIKKEVLSCGSDNRFVRYVYPDDIVSRDARIFRIDSCFLTLLLFVDMGVTRDPIEKYQGYESDGAEYVTSGHLYLPRLNIYRTLFFERKDRTITELQLMPMQPISNYTPIHSTSIKVLYNSNYDTISVKRYMSWNRLVYSKSKDELFPLEYTWSSDRMYPISKTQGDFTWSFSYLPFVGLRSETDPTGKTIYYQYDALGRLEDEYYMVDDIKQIINHYIYR